MVFNFNQFFFQILVHMWSYFHPIYDPSSPVQNLEHTGQTGAYYYLIGPWEIRLEFQQQNPKHISLIDIISISLCNCPQLSALKDFSGDKSALDQVMA